MTSGYTDVSISKVVFQNINKYLARRPDLSSLFFKKSKIRKRPHPMLNFPKLFSKKKVKVRD